MNVHVHLHVHGYVHVYAHVLIDITSSLLPIFRTLALVAQLVKLALAQVPLGTEELVNIQNCSTLATSAGLPDNYHTDLYFTPVTVVQEMQRALQEARLLIGQNGEVNYKYRSHFMCVMVRVTVRISFMGSITKHIDPPSYLQQGARHHSPRQVLNGVQGEPCCSKGQHEQPRPHPRSNRGSYA